MRRSQFAALCRVFEFMTLRSLQRFAGLRPADQSALEVHMGSEAFKSAGPALGAFLGGRPELTFLSVVGGKGAPQ